MRLGTPDLGGLGLTAQKEQRGHGSILGAIAGLMPSEVPRMVWRPEGVSSARQT